ncbi:MAG: SDR family NAD(P)-dependent oxidoreductase [Aeromonas sp.]
MARIIITGTRKGLGKALAEHYLAQGHQVAGCSRGPSSIEHAHYMHFCLDVADEKAVIAMVRSVQRTWQGIDILLNNAGMAAMNHLLTTPQRTAQNIVNTNVLGSFLFMREAGKIMMKQGQGSIVNYSTVAVALDLAGEALYAASKAAVESLTRIGAKELGQWGVRVNAIAPTPIKTDLIRHVPAAKLDELLQQQICQRFGEVSDVINVLDFFNCAESNYITGQIIYLGGVFK